MEKIYIDTAKILKAISDPKRLKIVDMLSCREQCCRKPSPLPSPPCPMT